MKSYKEFCKLAERYYEPHEPLPSGKTPKGKATSSYWRQRGEYFKDAQIGKRDGERRYRRLGQQRNRTWNQVSRGADNPNLNFRSDSSGKYNIYGRDNSMTVADDKAGIEMSVRQQNKVYFDKSNKTRTGKIPRPVYDIEWYSSKYTGRNNPGQARSTLRNVADMWKNQVEPRLPRNSVITNFPISNDTSTRNTRSKLYSKVANFGPRDEYTGRQYAKVGNNPSPKQAAKGASRIKPLTPEPGDITGYRTSDEMDRFNKNRERKFKPYGNSTATQGAPRKIAPAKPSRPSITREIKNLATKPPIKAPSLPQKVKTVSSALRKFKGRGKVGLALAGAGLIGSAINRFQR